MFDIINYRVRKSEVIELIKNSHDWQNSEGFIADGVINPDMFDKQKIKVLVLLAETYGYDQCGCIDIEVQKEEDILGVYDSHRQTVKKMASLLWLIFNSVEKNRLIQCEEFPELLVNNEKNTKLLSDTILKIAWVNVKKASKHIDKLGHNATRQIDSEIYAHAIKNKEILSKQIHSISSDVSIVCSNPVFNSLYDMGLLGKNIERNKKYQLQFNENNQMVIQVSHPGYFRDWSYDQIYNTYKLIYAGFEPKLNCHNVIVENGS